MKKEMDVKEAALIGKDSYELQHYEQLRENASASSQIEALKKDQQWQDDHNNEVCCRIDDLIHSIERRIYY